MLIGFHKQTQQRRFLQLATAITLAEVIMKQQLNLPQSNWILIRLLVGIDEWIRHVCNISLIDQASLINSVDLIQK